MGAVEEAPFDARDRFGSADCGEEAGGHPLDRVGSAIGVGDHSIAARQRGRRW
jgi:hypothetical protein